MKFTIWKGFDNYGTRAFFVRAKLSYRGESFKVTPLPDVDSFSAGTMGTLTVMFDRETDAYGFIYREFPRAEVVLLNSSEMKS